jgi:glycosyltransferase involved in cell wall biosynthesis
MIKVATNPELNEKMGRAAYERGAKKNSWGDFADRLIAICDSALQKRKTVGDRSKQF